MKGAFYIVILIALLIVGILTIKDMKTETADGVSREKAVERAEDAAKQAEEAMDRIKKSAKNIDIPSLE